MSNDNQHNQNNDGRVSPLRRFLDSRKETTDGDTAIKTSTTIPPRRQCGFQQTATYGSEDCSERSASRPQWSGASETKYPRYTSKSWHGKRSRKSKSFRADPKSNENNALPRVAGYCRCGEKAEAPYFERCENCFAEDSARWDGKDRSAKIHF